MLGEQRSAGLDEFTPTRVHAQAFVSGFAGHTNILLDQRSIRRYGLSTVSQQAPIDPSWKDQRTKLFARLLIGIALVAVVSFDIAVAHPVLSAPQATFDRWATIAFLSVEIAGPIVLGIVLEPRWTVVLLGVCAGVATIVGDFVVMIAPTAPTT